ncbi:MAG: hypothetical protein SVT56_09900 [Chloroflexota bacterium]|jgi:hypothetical protein|nr:hypothetical protein [Chloroflexota bacterium]
MTLNFILFDMDGVLLKPGGYYESLWTSVNRIGSVLGVPEVELRYDQIAKFESLSVTNEWGSLAICTALMLTHVWQFDGERRLSNLEPNTGEVIHDSPEFDSFLDKFINVGDLSGHSAYDLIMDENPWLNSSQRKYLYTYGLKPQLPIESFLLQHDRPVLSNDDMRGFQAWLSATDNAAGIMTNWPCSFSLELFQIKSG